MKKDFELITDVDGITVVIKKKSNYNYWDNDYNYNLFELSYQNTDFDMKKMKIIPENKICYRRMRNINDELADWRSREYVLSYVGEKALTEAEKQVKKNLRLYNAKIKIGFNNPLFLMLKPIADSKVKFYKSDFYRHDNIILQDNPNKFIWIVRECGTWLLTRQSDFAKNIVTSYGNKEDYYFYDNGNLTKTDKQGAINFYNQLPE